MLCRGTGKDGMVTENVFGSSVASNASSHLFGTFLLPTMLHEDPRYFVKAFGGPRSRILYAIERVVITRTDDGRNTFNWSGILGGLMAESLANSYLPGTRSAPWEKPSAGTEFGWVSAHWTMS